MWFSPIEIFNRTYDNLSKTLVVIDFLKRKVLEGGAFVVSHRFVAVGQDEVASLIIENPANSGKSLRVEKVEIDTFARAHVDIYRGSSITAGGNALEPVNLNGGSSNTSVAQAEYGGTYSGGTLVYDRVHAGGSGVRAFGSSSSFGEEIIVPENSSLLITVTNKDTSGSDISIVVTWVEE